MKTRKKKKIDPFKKIRKRTVRSHHHRPIVKLEKKALKDTLIRAMELVELTQDLKALYIELDEITQLLVDCNFTEGFVDGQRIYLKDNFATKNIAWKSTPMQRHRLEIGE